MVWYVALVVKEMICFRFILFLVSVLPRSSGGVEINMQGSVSLGKDVMDTLSHYVNKNKLNGRRSFGDVKVENHKLDDKDTIYLIVHSAFLCRNLDFCEGDLGKLLNTYIITLTEAVESVFRGLIENIDKRQKDNTVKAVIFEEELKQLILYVKKWLRNANEKKNTDDKEYYKSTWIHLLKKINAKFQDTAITFASQRLEGNVKETSIVKKELTQKLITLTTSVEIQFENKLCFENNICSESHECTIALKTLLEQLNNVSDERVQEFIRSFYETLPGTNFYYRISDVTAHEFQTILHEMSYGGNGNISAKNVLTTVRKTVEARLNAVTTKEVKLSGRDVKLVYVILSDMDYFYSKQKEPFYDFLGEFFEWSNRGGRFSSQLRRVMKDLQNMLTFESDELVLKLVNEVRVFMEVTIDPQH